MGRGPASSKRRWSGASRRWMRLFFFSSRRWMEVDGPILVTAAIRRSGEVRRSDSLPVQGRIGSWPPPTSGALRRESDPGGPLPPGTLSCRRGGVPRFADFGSSPPFCLEVCTSSTRRRPPVILPRPRPSTADSRHGGLPSHRCTKLQILACCTLQIIKNVLGFM